MIPFGLAEPQIKQRYLNFLEANSLALIKHLQQLFAMPLQNDVLSAEVQIFIQEDRMEIPEIWIYYSGIQNKISATPAEQIYAGQSFEIKIDFKKTFALAVEYYQNSHYHHIFADLAKQWFAICWWKACGWQYTIPCQVHAHDYGDANTIQLTAKETQQKK